MVWGQKNYGLYRWINGTPPRHQRSQIPTPRVNISWNSTLKDKSMKLVGINMVCAHKKCSSMVYLGMRLLIGYQMYGNSYHVSQVSLWLNGISVFRDYQYNEIEVICLSNTYVAVDICFLIWSSIYLLWEFYHKLFFFPCKTSSFKIYFFPL